MTVDEVCRKHGIHKQIFYGRRNQFSGLEACDLAKLKALEQENTRLKKALAEAVLYVQILEEIYDNAGNMWLDPDLTTLSIHFAMPRNESQIDAATNRLRLAYNTSPLPSGTYEAAGNLRKHPDIDAATLDYDAENRC